jgi:hypothetical protein
MSHSGLHCWPSQGPCRALLGGGAFGHPSSVINPLWIDAAWELTHASELPRAVAHVFISRSSPNSSFYGQLIFS